MFPTHQHHRHSDFLCLQLLAQNLSWNFRVVIVRLRQLLLTEFRFLIFPCFVTVFIPKFVAIAVCSLFNEQNSL